MEPNNVSLENISDKKENETLRNEVPPPTISVTPIELPAIITSTVPSTHDQKKDVLGPNDLKIGLTKITIQDDMSVQTPAVGSVSEIKRVGWRRYIGILLALSASFVHTLSSLIAKILTDPKMTPKPYHPITIGVWRFQGIFWPTLLTSLYFKIILKKDILAAFKPVKHCEKWKITAFLIFRGIFGVSGIIFQFYSFRFLALADSTVIVNSTPVCVTIVAHVFLRERCGIVPVLCGLVTLCGVMVISRPNWLTGAKDYDQNLLIGIAFSSGSMICATMVFVTLRGARAIHFSVVITFFGLFGSIVCLILTKIIHPFQLPQGRDHWLLAVAFLILTVLSQGFMTLSLKFEQAGPVSLIRTCDVIFAFIWQGIFLSVIPDAFSYIGAFVVVTGVLIIGLKKWVEDLPVDSAVRLKLSFLLK